MAKFLTQDKRKVRPIDQQTGWDGWRENQMDRWTDTDVNRLLLD